MESGNLNQVITKKHNPLPQKFIYIFSSEQTDGHAGMKSLLGGKGANLAEMSALGLSVPPGFTISTEICQVYNQAQQQLPTEVKVQIENTMKQIEKIMGKHFGDPQNPLLMSVRSGARASMPGMMDTILNLGMNDRVVEGLAEQSGQPRFAWDSYRRFLQMYSDVVMGMNSSYLEMLLEDVKEAQSYKSDTELTVPDLKSLVEKFKQQILHTTGQQFPLDPYEQLWGAIGAVFKSWNTARAKTYRELHGIPSSWGTAVNIQTMVFGNRGDDSATGVAFTRNPSTGENKIYGEFLINAQGEDVVAGIRTPQPLTKESGLNSLEELMPEMYQQLKGIFSLLEKHYRDMQDIEFTIEQGRLWILQTRVGKRTARAALRIACDQVDEGLINKSEALLRLDPKSLDQLLHPTLDPQHAQEELTQALPASPGGAVGKIVFNSEQAVEAARANEKVILVRVETSPEDIEGMVAAQGILTSRGGMTSHAAVVARGMGKCCVAGAGEIDIDYNRQELRCKNQILKIGDLITLDGSTGKVFLGEVKMLPPQMDEYFNRVMKWTDEFRQLGVRANADTPLDAKVARQFGAEGIGLCRTEHMFFAPERIDIMRKMIFSDQLLERIETLNQLAPLQHADFKGLFREMKGCPVTIRLLDPPLHEFLPHLETELVELAGRLKCDVEKLRSKVRNLREQNPMLGHRGCRLAVTYPEIYQMQVRAVAEAACDLIDSGEKVEPEIMIPLVASEAELKMMKELVVEVVEQVQQKRKVVFRYFIGTMIELPRAALVADELAHHAEFFSFGTNDLTQTTLGLSRDDSGKFLSTYVAAGLYDADPFASIDVKGVGKLVQKGVELGRQTRPDIKLGICGEHGGDPASIDFFQQVGLNYVSCSPFRVPIARLAAAQSVLKQGKVAH